MFGCDGVELVDDLRSGFLWLFWFSNAESLDAFILQLGLGTFEEVNELL